MRDIDLSAVSAVCNDCARTLGFTPKNKIVGVWTDECGVCHQRKPCTNLWHDWNPPKRGGRQMTWLEFKRKVGEVTSRMTSDAVPITFLHGTTEIRPTDITIGCEITGDKLALIIDLKEGDGK